MDVDHLAILLGGSLYVALLIVLNADTIVIIYHLRAVVHVLVVVVVLTAEKSLFQAIH